MENWIWGERERADCYSVAFFYCEYSEKITFSSLIITNIFARIGISYFPTIIPLWLEIKWGFLWCFSLPCFRFALFTCFVMLTYFRDFSSSPDDVFSTLQKEKKQTSNFSVFSNRCVKNWLCFSVVCVMLKGDISAAVFYVVVYEVEIYFWCVTRRNSKKTNLNLYLKVEKRLTREFCWRMLNEKLAKVLKIDFQALALKVFSF